MGQREEHSALPESLCPDLAFVAESAFITERTRDELGVHSTPEGSRRLDRQPRHGRRCRLTNVWYGRPFCGHGVFLAKAMERLRQDIDPSVPPKERHEYFRQRLIGVETDPLALEICRLMLTNTDYPNGNTWEKLYQRDVFRSRSGSPHCSPPLWYWRTHHTRPSRQNTGGRSVRLRPSRPGRVCTASCSSRHGCSASVLPQSFSERPVYQEANLRIG